MLIIKKYVNHYETFVFHLHCDNVYHEYLSNFQLFENFIHYYKDIARKMITKANQHCVIIDAQYLPENQHQSDYSSSQVISSLDPHLRRYYLKLDETDVAVSAKEYACLSLLAHGKQHPAIATELDISLRTVETYLSRLKFKLKLNDREDLLKVYWKNKILSA
jgi:DNA-binding NarL/FixJ family response regulator